MMIVARCIILAHVQSAELSPITVLVLGIIVLLCGIGLVVLRPNFLRGGLLSKNTQLGMLLERRAPRVRHAYGLLQLLLAASFMIVVGLVCIAISVARMIGFGT